MEYILKTTKAFKKDFKRCQKQGLPMEKLRSGMEHLSITVAFRLPFDPISTTATAKGNGSVTSNQTGFSFGNRTTPNSSS